MEKHKRLTEYLKNKANQKKKDTNNFQHLSLFPLGEEEAAASTSR
jgi:hypothetical protein